MMCPVPRFHLQVVTSSIRPLHDVADTLVGVLKAGADSVQLRDYDASPAEADMLVNAIDCEVADAGVRLIVHEHLFVPGSTGTRWRHLSSTTINTAGRMAATPKEGPEAPGGVPFGASVHSLSEARLAVSAGAAYLSFGHVFWTSSHPGAPPRGVEALVRIVGSVELPVLAIGGITPDNVDSLLSTGCAGVAVSSAILAEDEPDLAAQRFRAVLDKSPHRPRYPFPGL